MRFRVYGLRQGKPFWKADIMVWPFERIAHGLARIIISYLRDLVFYRRYKTPADLPANTLTDRARLSISRWYGPARILATETKGEAGEKRPSSHVWIIAQGRLKKCHYSQLRHATRTEQLVAAEAQGVTFPWTMTSLTSLLEKGAYEDLTRAESHFPEDLEVDGPTESGPPLAQGTELSDEEMIPADPELRKCVAPEVNEDEEMIQDPEGDVDLERLLNDPTYDPLHPLPDLSQSRQSFLQQRARHEQDDRPWHVRHGDASFYASVESSSKIYAITIDAPADAQGWKKMVKNPEKFATKGVEISWSRLTDVQRKAMAEAKGLEIGQWVEHQVCRKFAEKVPDHQLLRMRWVLTFKEAPPADDGRPQLKAKARIVILGFSDPGLLEDQTASPTMTRLTRQLVLNQAMLRGWTVFSADVRTAFLQARPTDRGRRLLAKPLPELARALNLSDSECIELTGSAYGLSTAPREWFQDVAQTIRRLGGRQCKTDPCAWVIVNAEQEVVGYLSSHVDDFLVAGSQTDKTWLNFVQGFRSAYKWSPWESHDFQHCGLRVLQHEDCSFTLDHSVFCAELNQPPADPQQTTMNENQLRQAKAILGSVQWRVTQSGPHHAAKLGHLQSLLASKDISCIDQVNKLVREVQAAKHVGVQVQHLGNCQPSQVHFVAWSDASLANRHDGGSTGGYVIGIMHPSAVLQGQGRVSVISWRSFRLPRVARSSLPAEAQALGHCEHELMFARLEWHELNGGVVDVREPTKSTSQVPGHLIIDARGVFDALEKADPGMASFNVKDKYTSLELTGISDNLKLQATELGWCDSDHQLADGLTKASKQDALKKFLIQGHWRLRHPGAFMSAKKRRSLEASKGASSSFETSCDS